MQLLSDNGVRLEEISRLVGHSSTAMTELVYRKQIRPVLQGSATVTDRIFDHDALVTQDETRAASCLLETAAHLR